MRYACVVKRIATIRLYPTPRQSAALEHNLHITRQLYNALLFQRIDAWRTRRRAISSKEQYAQITELRSADPRFAAIYRESEDAVLRRLDLAFAAFFRRVKRGETPGFPRYRSARRWRQLQFPHGERALKFDAAQKRIGIPGIGSVPLRRGRAVPTFGRAWLVKKNGRWYAQFECEVAPQPLPASLAAVGLDRGVRVLLATSDGEHVANPRFIERSRRKIERLQRIVAKRLCGGRNRARAVRQLARAHERIASQRRDYAHKVAAKIIADYGAIVLEDLRVSNMTRSAKGTLDAPGRNVRAKAGLNRAILDAGFGLIRQLIVEKAERAVREVVLVDARYTSQECSRCHVIDGRARRGATFHCASCDFSCDADVNAAGTILFPGRVAACAETRRDAERR